MQMKRIAIAAFSILFGACSKSDSLQTTGLLQNTGTNEMTNAAAKSQGAPAPIEVAAPNVFPEGMVYDPFNDRFLVSSITMGTIGAVTKAGTYSPFIVDPDLASTAGMEIDKAHKLLLVTSSTQIGNHAKLAIYDLNTGNRLYLVDLLAVANDGAPHLANDVALDQQGNAYVTDSYAGIIYKVDSYGNASIFYHNTSYTPGPNQFGFNGIEFSSSKGGYFLVGHTLLAQVLRIPIDNPAAFTIVQFSPAITSPDGLLLSKNSKQLIVVNNTAFFPGSNVTTCESNDSWATASSKGTVETGIVYPTTLTSDGKTEYVLYSYLNFLFTMQPHQTFTIQPLPFSSNNPF
jgi:sugar lactone lactonase YvrE